MTTSEKTCTKCGLSKPIHDFYAHKKMKDGRLNKCKECAKIDARKNYADNIDKKREYDRRRSMLPHRVAAREEYKKTDIGKIVKAKSAKKYANNNKQKRKLIKLICQTRRHAAKIMRSPKWVGEEGKAKIAAKYAEAKWMTIRNGIKHHVDHIYPLLGEFVCGLHVPENLRVIPARENIKKSNKTPGKCYPA